MALKTLYFCKFIKKLIETIFAKNVAKHYEKKILLGASDAWSMSHLSQRSSEPVYYIEDFRIFLSVKLFTQAVFTLSSVIIVGIYISSFRSCARHQNSTPLVSPLSTLLTNKSFPLVVLLLLISLCMQSVIILVIIRNIVFP